METYLELSKAAQEQILEAAKQNQKIALQATQAWVQAAAPYASQIPAAPGLEGVPTPAEFVENSFGFAKKVVELQQDFALDVAKTWAPNAKTSAKPKTASA